MKRYSKEQCNYLLTEFNKLSKTYPAASTDYKLELLTKKFNDKFNSNRTLDAIRNKMGKLIKKSKPKCEDKGPKPFEGIEVLVKRNGEVILELKTKCQNVRHIGESVESMLESIV